MKIVQICPYAMDRPGGVQTHVRDLSRWLVHQGHEVRIIAPPSPGRAAQVHDYLLELGRARNFALHGTAFELSVARPAELQRCARDLRDWGAELIHLHTPWTPMLAGQMWRRLRLPTVTAIHATLPEVAGKGLIDRYIRRSARYFLTRSAAVVVPSEAPLPMLRRLLPDLEATALPPAIDLTAWRAAAKPREVGNLTFAFLGRLEARKGVDVLLRAWPQIATALPEARLHIAGDGELRAQVCTAESDSLRYLGRVDDTEAQDLLGTADILLAPAPFGESYGLVLAEAMSAGAVPIAAANPGYASVLGDQDALLVPPGDAEALAQTAIRLAGDPENLQSMRRWASAQAIVSDVVRAGPKYEAIFDEVLTRTASPGR